MHWQRDRCCLQRVFFLPRVCSGLSYQAKAEAEWVPSGHD